MYPSPKSGPHSFRNGQFGGSMSPSPMRGRANFQHGSFGGRMSPSPMRFGWHNASCFSADADHEPMGTAKE